MNIAIVAKVNPQEGSEHALANERVITSAAQWRKATLVELGEVQPFDHPFTTWRPSKETSAMARALELRDRLNNVSLIHCLDVGAAHDVILSGVKAPIVCEPWAMPSLSYQHEESVETSVLENLVSTEERVLRRCRYVRYSNLFERRFLGIRGVSEAQLYHQMSPIPKPQATLSKQSLAQIVYEHDRLRDAEIVFEAIQRLRIPFRMKVHTDTDEGRRFWERDRRIQVIRTDWVHHLSCAMIALVGGASSARSASGTHLSRFALWGPHFGVSVVGTENTRWRALLGGAGLVPPERPDHLSEIITRVLSDREARATQHSQIVRHHGELFASRHEENLANLWSEFTSS